jgi:hypothetical protein
MGNKVFYECLILFLVILLLRVFAVTPDSSYERKQMIALINVGASWVLRGLRLPVVHILPHRCHHHPDHVSATAVACVCWNWMRLGDLWQNSFIDSRFYKNSFIFRFYTSYPTVIIISATTFCLNLNTTFVGIIRGYLPRPRLTGWSSNGNRELFLW